MFKQIRKQVAFFIAPEYRDAIAVRDLELQEKEQKIEEKINSRVAQILMQMDPFEPILRQFHGVFSDEYEQVEERFDEQSKVRMYMWAYGQRDDPQANFLSDFIMNTAGNEVLKRKEPTPERILYFRSQIANEILRKSEISRLALHYEEIIKRKDEEFDSSVGIE